MSTIQKPEDDLAKLRVDLGRTLQSASEVGRQIVNQGHDISAAGQKVTDWADAIKGTLPFIRDPATLSALNKTWARTDQYARYFTGKLAGFSLASLASSTDVSSVSSVLDIGRLWVSYGVGEPNMVAAGVAFGRVRDLANRPDSHTSVLSLLRDLHLDDHIYGTLSALEQFETAHKAFSVNASVLGLASTWLLPMRECILTVLSDLLKRRPTQEETKGTIEKVVSILMQIGRSDVPKGHLEELGDACKKLLENQLSPSKQVQVTRLESESILMAATLWVKAFLEAIDPIKATKPAR